MGCLKLEHIEPIASPLYIAYKRELKAEPRPQEIRIIIILERDGKNWKVYAYVLNNPLKYTDPSGEFLGTIFTAAWDFFDTVFTEGGIDPWNTSDNRRAAWKNFDPTRSGSKTNLAWGIDRGAVEGNFGQIVSKLTWQLPQTLVGNLASHGLNIAGQVNGIAYFEGATVLDTDITGGAFTAGSYIIGPEGFKPDFRDHLFVHEFGHYKQSQRLGPLYLPLVALPSVADSWIVDKLFGVELHGTRWYEAQASRLGSNWFDDHYGTGADGYVEGSPEYFDRRSFENRGVFSPYTNSRTGFYNGGGNPTSPVFHWTDIPINLLFNGGFGLFGYL